MFERKPSFTKVSIFTTGILILLITLFIPSTVYADDPAPPSPDNGKCMSCHEDLYFLHDTGKWFCLKESPMTCVDCHGGDPTALTKEVAHASFAPHPVINDDVSKCEECHPDQCPDRVELFKQESGISNVLIAVPYIPPSSSEFAEAIPVTGQQDQQPYSWMNLMEVAPILLICGVVLIVYFYYRIRHTHGGSS